MAMTIPRIHYPSITLASSSPRRRDILDQLGIPYCVYESNVDEVCSISDATERVCHLAEKKARASIDKVETEIIIAADTVVALHTDIFEKPQDQDEARDMLSALSNTEHIVHTGITLVHNKDSIITKSASTKVYFMDIPDSVMSAYLESEQWKGVAGGYRIQGFGSLFIQKIEGNYSTVMGLSIPLFYDMMKKYITF